MTDAGSMTVVLASRLRLGLVLLVVACQLWSCSGSGAAMQLHEPSGPWPELVPGAATHTAVILVGDGGHARQDDLVMQLLRRAVQDALAVLPSDRVVVVLLGDNVYPRGVEADAPELPEALAAQLHAASGAQAVVIPGNHDWDHSGPLGQAKVERMNQLVEEAGAHALPGPKCPAPAVLDAGGTVRIIAVDSQIWLHEDWDREHPYCTGTADRVATLRASLLEAEERGLFSVVASHHPLVTVGPHGGRRLLRRPFSQQDRYATGYRQYREDLAVAAEGLEDLVWAAGHDHSLQILPPEDGFAWWQIISGGASQGHTTRVAERARGFARSANGLVRLDFEARRVQAVAVVLTEQGLEIVQETIRDAPP